MRGYLHMSWHQISVITDKKTATEVSDFFSDIRRGVRYLYGC